MPTFDDPLADAAEASAALRGLAHATRAMPDPATTYPVLGDLLAGMRSLRQVADQLARAHIDNRALAFDDAGDQAAGATSALAAADELHQIGTLLDTVMWRLDAASQHSGRIAWQPVGSEGAEVSRTTARVGTLSLTVWPDEPLGGHQRYAYRIEDQASGESVGGRDLFTGAGAPVAPERALRELAVFLAAAAEARQYAIDNPGTHPENEGLFPAWAADAARQNSDELTMLGELGPAPAAENAAAEPAPPRWISVVFLQGEEADAVLDLIARRGTDAAIEHLAGFDYGDETTQAALENGYVYDELPRGTLDRVATKDAYTLTYSPFLGHVSLLREHDVLPDPALLDIDRPTPAASRVTAPRRGGTGAVTDWFSRPAASSVQSRGLVL